MSSNVKTFVFAIVMCLICSFVLTSAVTLLRERQQENVVVDKQKNILKALFLLEPHQKYTSKDIVRLYTENVTDKFMLPSGELSDTSDNGANLPVHVVYAADGEIAQYAIPISGYGLWSWIYGFFALEGDGNTVLGITFYKHGETPGLGGEVEKEWFQSQFKGKKIVDAAGQLVSIDVVKGKAKDVAANRLDHAVDGISGATITAAGVRDFLKTDLLRYEPLSSRLRQTKGVSTVPSQSEAAL
jgi:Na+-transporting NADH:ubiquinone oxidoreductase subunit C